MRHCKLILIKLTVNNAGKSYTLDVQLRGADAALRYNALCAFWSQYGADLKFGLGFYGENQIHIDGAGWRTWGADYTRKSSPCHR